MRRALASVVENLERIRRRKVVAREAIAGGVLPLRAGTWRLGPNFSRHASVVSLPPPLDSSKQWGGWRAGRLIRGAVHSAEIWLPPRKAYVKKNLGGPDETLACNVLLINRLGEAVGFDTDSALVVRTMDDNDLQLAQRNAELLRPAYECVCPTRVPGTALVVEPLIVGQNFAQATTEQRFGVVEDFLEGLARQVIDPLSPDLRQSWSTSARRVATFLREPSSLLPEVLSALDELTEGAKTCFVHGDIFSDNIIVTGQGPLLIDIDKAGPAPAFTDILTLIVFEARTRRTDLGRALFAGQFDAQLRALGCGLPTIEPRLQKLTLFCGWLGWKMVTETFSQVNLDRFLDVLDDLKSPSHPS